MQNIEYNLLCVAVAYTRIQYIAQRLDVPSLSLLSMWKRCRWLYYVYFFFLPHCLVKLKLIKFRHYYVVRFYSHEINKSACTIFNSAVLYKQKNKHSLYGRRKSATGWVIEWQVKWNKNTESAEHTQNVKKRPKLMRIVRAFVSLVEHIHTHTPFELWMNLNRLGLRVFAFTVCLNTREIAPILTPNRPILGQVKIGWKIREICHEWFASVCRCAGEIWKVHSIFTCNFHNTNSITSHSHCINGNQVLPFAEARRHALNSSVDDDGREADGNKGRTVCFYVIALIFL